jgi:hypothetical protein
MNERALYEALTRLKNDKSLSVVKEWLDTMREESRNRLETQVDHVAQEQGKAQVLKKILDAIDKAPEILARMA